jgi:hypothetical protein
MNLEFVKADTEKPRMSLLPPRAMIALGDVLTYGAKKYAPDNWRKVDDLSRYTSAALRHVFRYMGGERDDPETGMHHLAHAACSLLFIVDLDLEREAR